MTYLHRNYNWIPVDIGGTEAEQPEPRADKTILATVVIDQPIAMVASVVLNGQALGAVQKIWTAQEVALIVMDRNLNVRPRESSEHKEHS